MTLSIRQKSNIRHFIFYLVNGTLDFELIQETFGEQYYKILKKKPEYFYKTACVYINQETALNPSWPDTKRLGLFICKLHNTNIDNSDFKDWETNFTTDTLDFSSDFKRFTNWFINSTIVPNTSYEDYISEGASFSEQCFAIWTNVITLDNNKVTNFDFACERVEQYVKSYCIKDYEDNLEEWECELHME